MTMSKKILCFQQITDSRFDSDLYEELNKRISLITRLINATDSRIVVFEIKSLTFPDGTKQCRADFRIRKSGSVTWRDVYKLINSVKAVPYALK